VVVTDDDPGLAETIARQVVASAWERRHTFVPEIYPPEEAIRRALAIPGGPVVLSESSDAPSAGSPGDSVFVLRALLEADVQEPCLLAVVDGEAVQKMMAAGPGKQVTLALGHKTTPRWAEPLTVTGTVERVVDMEFEVSFLGTRFATGKGVVFRIGSLQVLVLEKPIWMADPSLYRAAGLEPTQAKIVLAKSPCQFRFTYEPIAKDVFVVDTPGFSPANLTHLPWQRISRPLFPLDNPVLVPVSLAVRSADGQQRSAVVEMR